MKRALIVILLALAALAAILLWNRGHRSEQKAAEEKPEEEGASHVTHDEQGRAVVKIDDETQGNMGLLVTKPAAVEQSSELKAYGRVLDPSPLAGLMTELATAQAAFIASSNELARLQMLAAQQNASERALQTAQAAAQRDQLAIQSAKDKLALSWGRGIAEQTNLAAFIQPLTTLAAVLVRVDLPIGETLARPPQGARIAALSGKTAEGEFLGTASNVDPQTLGRGAIFEIQPNSLGMMSGEPVTAFLQMPGTPVTGVRIPSEAVVRTEGRAWAYVMNTGGDAFTRIDISLDHPIAGGWFVRSGVSTNDYLVTTGAQTLLSEELKSSLKSD
jgi:multidrug efflux pump subunit AcrA (membrane-fusion protein)